MSTLGTSGNKPVEDIPQITVWTTVGITGAFDDEFDKENLDEVLTDLGTQFSVSHRQMRRRPSAGASPGFAPDIIFQIAAEIVMSITTGIAASLIFESVKKLVLNPRKREREAKEYGRSLTPGVTFKFRIDYGRYTIYFQIFEVWDSQIFTTALQTWLDSARRIIADADATQSVDAEDEVVVFLFDSETSTWKERSRMKRFLKTDGSEETREV